MRRLHLSAAAAALFIALGLPTRGSAQAVTCKDGTTSSQSGQGACSHHGGVAAVATPVSCRDGTTSTAGRGACSHHGGVGTATASKGRSWTRSRSSDEARPASEPTYGIGTVNCRDGTTSSGGRGACSHHGGVAAASTRASRTEPSPSSTPTYSGEAVACRDGTTSSAGRGACSHHGGVDVASSKRAPLPAPTTERDLPPPPPPVRPGAPADASALCNDGTYSHTAHRSGACSHHRGVRQWFKDLPVRWY
jgi:hypothetical protein